MDEFGGGIDRVFEPGHEVVHDADLVATGHKDFGHHAADKARSAGNQHSHEASPKITPTASVKSFTTARRAPTEVLRLLVSATGPNENRLGSDGLARFESQPHPQSTYDWESEVELRAAVTSMPGWGLRQSQPPFRGMRAQIEPRTGRLSLQRLRGPVG